MVRSSGPIAARTSRRSFIFAPQPTVTLSRPCREKAKKHRRGRWCRRDSQGSARCGTGHFSPPTAVRPAHPGTAPRQLQRPLLPRGGRHRRPAQVPEPSFRPSPRPNPSPGGLGRPSPWSGPCSEAQKGPNSPNASPAAPFNQEVWGARYRFRTCQLIGTASNTY